jgi:hypothetical protein
VKKPVALVLVAAALLAAPTPEALAHAPSQEPRELWRQFPLETGRSTPQARAERVSAPTPGGTPGEGTDRSVGPVPTAAIVLAMALVLLLMTGVLAAYAVRGQLDFGALGRRRRLAPSFPELLAAPPGEALPHADTERPRRRQPDSKRTVRDPGRPRRRAKRSAVASITSEVEALRRKLVDADQTKTESPTQDRIGRLRERLNVYFASATNAGTANVEVENLKAKLDVHRASAKSEGIPPDERERLKEKLGMQPAYAESASHDELKTLKEKLSMQAAAPKGVSTTRKEVETLKAKLGKEAALASARETADSVAPKEDRAPASAAVDGRDTPLRERRREPAAATTPVAPRPVSAPTRRSTIFELVYEYGSNVAMIGLGLIILALLLLNIAVFFGIGVEPY